MLRDVNCGELRINDSGRKVKIAGWIKKIRDHGDIIFIDLWDRYGKTQIVIRDDKDLLKTGKKLGIEWVVLFEGVVSERPEGMKNKDFPTGDIEVIAERIEILNPSKVPPFVIEEEIKAQEDLRLKYRYLDLRRKSMIKNFEIRHKFIQIVRDFLSSRNFLEVDTPILAKSTPEGARDFLVPSRLYKGKFYALAQSPQLYKQILMVSGFDRYYQFAKCLRDEDLRGDRQFEFTQIDIEASFVEIDDILNLVDEMVKKIFFEILGLKIESIPRYNYKYVMERYGSDKPDLRNPLFIEDFTDIVKKTDFRIFKESEFTGGIRVKEILSRGKIGEIEERIKKEGAKGILFISRDNEYKGNFIKYVKPEEFRMEEGETILLISGEKLKTLKFLGRLRDELFKPEGNDFSILWVLYFPLFELDEENNSIVPCHHIFTSPLNSIEDVEKNPLNEPGKQYDLVINGVEIASGSIRNHNPDVQKRLFKIMGLDEKDMEERFGFLLEALSYGAPPHGGIAIGFDRFVAIISGEKSIRNVIAFPKTYQGYGLMEGSPGSVSEKELKELGIMVYDKEKDKNIS
uniref:Aspartate--tRNA(Asp/Asn) ligase n=1 Tax=candidate division WOR-3 bacterium TaxID=2052148 RepID=A0A7C4UCP1_UNCW3